jgi:hypothetical protein
MIMVFVVLSPDSPLPLRISGRPATFMERTLKDPDVCAITDAAQARAMKQALRRRVMVEETGGLGRIGKTLVVL